MLLSIRTCTHTYIVTHLIKNWVDICECGYNSEPTELTISASLHVHVGFVAKFFNGKCSGSI